jgi:hypothetical protein
MEGYTDGNAALIRSSAAAIKDATTMRFMSTPPIELPTGFMDSLTVRCPLDAGEGACGHALGSWGALPHLRLASSVLFCDHCGVGVCGYHALFPAEVGKFEGMGHLVG